MSLLKRIGFRIHNLQLLGKLYLKIGIEVFYNLQSTMVNRSNFNGNMDIIELI